MMRIKHVNMDPVCREKRLSNWDFDGDYHPACCRFPKSCSPYKYEIYPEDTVELPVKLSVKRTGYGAETEFAWMVIGKHPKSPGTVTLLKYFDSYTDALKFSTTPITLDELLRAENIQ